LVRSESFILGFSRERDGDPKRFKRREVEGGRFQEEVKFSRVRTALSSTDLSQLEVGCRELNKRSYIGISGKEMKHRKHEGSCFGVGAAAKPA